MKPRERGIKKGPRNNCHIITYCLKGDCQPGAKNIHIEIVATMSHNAAKLVFNPASI